MGKSKKASRSFTKRPASPRIHFEIEDNADELLHEFLATMPPHIYEHKEDHRDLPIPDQQRRSRPHPPLYRLDLHGFTLEDAKRASKKKIHELLTTKLGSFIVEVITGRGLHSGRSGSILVREIYHVIHTEFRANIVKIDAPPTDSILDGLPLRGSFRVYFSTSAKR